MIDKTALQQPRGFQKGQSGNPAGRGFPFSHPCAVYDLGGVSLPPVFGAQFGAVWKRNACPLPHDNGTCGLVWFLKGERVRSHISKIGFNRNASLK